VSAALSGASPAIQIATAPQSTALAPTREATSRTLARRRRIVPYSGTTSDDSISRNGSRPCIGSTSASPVHSTAIVTPRRRTLPAGARLWPATAPEQTSPPHRRHEKRADLHHQQGAREHRAPGTQRTTPAAGLHCGGSRLAKT
jgi:hypothetical protein